jgi:molybdopterin molybdotransferase
MISVEHARAVILSEVRLQPAETIPLQEAAGRILAEPIVTPFDLPFFDNSSVDGYAVRISDLANASDASPVHLRIAATVAAGDSAEAKTRPLQSGQTVHVLTGAMIPSGAEAMIRQEDVVLQDDTGEFRRPARQGECIRYRGEEMRKGDTLLETGTRLTSAAIGLLAGVGVRELTAFAFPRVGLLVTGSEIVHAASAVSAGKIFDSNSPALTAALRELGVPIAFAQNATDDPTLIRNAIGAGLECTDVLIVTGGVSVGMHDYVKEAAAGLGLERIFWRVKQKPGKPMLFAASEDRSKLLFGLPGNPASALVCFCEYVRPALLRAMGAAKPCMTASRAPLADAISKPAGLTHFMKAKLSADGSVRVLGGQGSHMMSSFAAADCLAVIPEAATDLSKGEMVEIHLLPS